MLLSSPVRFTSDRVQAGATIVNIATADPCPPNGVWRA